MSSFISNLKTSRKLKTSGRVDGCWVQKNIMKLHADLFTYMYVYICTYVYVHISKISSYIKWLVLFY